MDDVFNKQGAKDDKTEETLNGLLTDKAPLTDEPQEEPKQDNSSVEPETEGATQTAETGEVKFPDWIKEKGLDKENPELAKRLAKFKDENEALKAYAEIESKSGRLANEVGEQRKKEIETYLDSLLKPLSEEPSKEQSQTTETPEEEEDLFGETPDIDTFKKIAQQEARAQVEAIKKQILLREAHKELISDLKGVLSDPKKEALFQKYYDFIKEETKKVVEGGVSPFFSYPDPFSKMIVFKMGQENFQKFTENTQSEQPPPVAEGKGKPAEEKPKSAGEKEMEDLLDTTGGRRPPF